MNPAPGLDTCLLYEDDSDQDAYLFPLPMVDKSNDGPEDLMALSRPTTFRPDVPIEPAEEIPLHQEDGTRAAHFGSKFFSMGFGTQKIEGRFDARNVTKPIFAAGSSSTAAHRPCRQDLAIHEVSHHHQLAVVSPSAERPLQFVEHDVPQPTLPPSVSDGLPTESNSKKHKLRKTCGIRRTHEIILNRGACHVSGREHTVSCTR